MKEISKKVAKLIDVKTIVTLSLTGAFMFLAGTGKVEGEKLVTIYTMIIGFYFGTQSNKKDEEPK